MSEKSWVIYKVFAYDTALLFNRKLGLCVEIPVVKGQWMRKWSYLCSVYKTWKIGEETTRPVVILLHPQPLMNVLLDFPQSAHRIWGQRRHIYPATLHLLRAFLLYNLAWPGDYWFGEISSHNPDQHRDGNQQSSLSSSLANTIPNRIRSLSCFEDHPTFNQNGFFNSYWITIGAAIRLKEKRSSQQAI